MSNILKRTLVIFIAIIGAMMFLFEGFYVLEKTPITFAINENPTKDTIVYFINLDRSKERLATFLPLVEALGLPYERISAVNGKELSQEELDKLVVRKSFKKKVFRAGEIGCYLSHTKAWEKFLKSDYKYALIFEDDVSFDPQLLKTTIERMKQEGQLWDITTFNVNPEGKKPFWPVMPIDEDHSLGYYPHKILSSGGYIINRKAGEKLLTYAYPIQLELDVYFTRSWEMDLKYAGVEPVLVKQTFGDSEIAIPKSQTVKENRYGDMTAAQEVHFFFGKTTFNAKTAVIKWCHTLKNYLHAKKG